jgi:hypothetical protein
MSGTLPERVAVVSCHVERPLADEVWERFRRLQERRPAGFGIAALLRPADAASGEDEKEWAARAREAARRGPLGQHTHWTAPDHARPREEASDGTGERVLAECRRLRELGLEPTFFCGGGWYTDAEVAEACAELGYVDCTPRARRPRYLPPESRWVSLAQPAVISLPSGRSLLAIPTTHSVGELGRALLSRRLPGVVHLYFHDTDLVDRRRAAMLEAVLGILARRSRASDLETLAGALPVASERLDWAEVAQPAP